MSKIQKKINISPNEFGPKLEISCVRGEGLYSSEHTWEVALLTDEGVLGDVVGWQTDEDVERLVRKAKKGNFKEFFKFV